VGGDILANKKTFLLIHAKESRTHKNDLERLMRTNSADKVDKVLAVYKDCKTGEWALEIKNKYLNEALAHLDDIAVLSKRKEPLRELALFLVRRDH
jgi:geranylgeranyl diphosphate synthase type II